MNKLPTTPTQLDIINKIDEIVDDKQDTLVSGTNIKTVNNQSLLGSGNIQISSGGTATDVQINGTSITNNYVANIVTETAYNPLTNKIVTKSDIPTDNNELTNGAGYITGINGSDVTTALGYTPYDNTNPDGYTDNVGTVTSVNNANPDANGNVTLSIPAAQVNSDWNASSGVAQILNKPTLSTVATTGDYDDLTNKPTIPAEQVQSNWNETDTSSKAYIQNKPTIPSPVTVDDALSTTSENPVQNKVINSALGDKLDKSGGTMTGDLSVGSSSIGTNGWIQGTWLRATAATSLESATDIAVLSNGWIYKQSKSTLLNGYQTTTNLVTSVSSSSTDSQYPSAKLFYDTVGDIETLINAL